MNLYIVVEGDQTEMLLYPKWLEFVLPEISRARVESDVKDNDYYLFSGGGIPSIYNHTVNAIKNINDNPIFNYLIVSLDGEEIGPEIRIKEISNYISGSKVLLNNKCKIVFVVQNVCIETWLLGNRKIVKRIPEGTLLKKFMAHYNVISEDPELMDKIPPFRTKAQLHYSYFREVMKEHGLSYSKCNPKTVLTVGFFSQLLKRIESTSHLGSFKGFMNILYKISEELKN